MRWNATLNITEKVRNTSKCLCWLFVLSFISKINYKVYEYQTNKLEYCKITNIELTSNLADLLESVQFRLWSVLNLYWQTITLFPNSLLYGISNFEAYINLQPILTKVNTEEHIAVTSLCGFGLLVYVELSGVFPLLVIREQQRLSMNYHVTKIMFK